MPRKPSATQYIAVYVRVSSGSQSHRSQLPDLERWVAAFAEGQDVRWYREKVSGSTMDRPEWSRLEADMRAGKVSKLVTWRLDRLGRTYAGMAQFLEYLVAAGIGLVSLREGMDLETPAGRLVAHVMASVAAYERERSRENQAAGIAAAKEAGKTWGGRVTGKRNRRTAEVESAARSLRAGGESIAGIARILGVSRPTVYSVLQDAAPKPS